MPEGVDMPAPVNAIAWLALQSKVAAFCTSELEMLLFSNELNLHRSEGIRPGYQRVSEFDR